MMTKKSSPNDDGTTQNAQKSNEKWQKYPLGGRKVTGRRPNQGEGGNGCPHKRTGGYCVAALPKQGKILQKVQKASIFDSFGLFHDDLTSKLDEIRTYIFITYRSTLSERNTKKFEVK